MSPDFWRTRKVLITGHTGFKGSWLSLWLQSLKAEVIGYALSPPTAINLFELAAVAEGMTSVVADIRDYNALQKVIHEYQPEIIFHMAAQSLVRYSYQNPIETYATNVMGTVHLLEAARQAKCLRAVINVTSDKCYANKDYLWSYQEEEPMGGYDPYSSSKGCAELVTSAYRSSFFNSPSSGLPKLALASARAGNVIGGGDWAFDRLIPDIMNACLNNQPLKIRNPEALRPWQHVLEPLSGYLALAEALYEQPQKFCEGWNFGPNDQDIKPVEWITESLIKYWGKSVRWEIDSEAELHEATYLKLDCSKAKTKLGWQPKWTLDAALKNIVDWYEAYQNKKDMREFTLMQIQTYKDC